MRKILVVNGSPRKSGNTDKLCRAFIEGAKQAGHEITYYPLSQYPINGCLGCESCLRTGKCVQKDAMASEIFDKLVECDTVVMASPVYCYMCTSLLKAFVERTYPMSVLPMGRRKDAIMLATAGAGGSVFSPLKDWHRANIGYIGWRDAGGVYAGGCGMSVPSRYLDEAKKLGASLK